MAQSAVQVISYGIIPIRKQHDAWQVFIIQHKAGHWGFPKGHPNSDQEAPQQVAERELHEETGLNVKQYVFKQPLSVNYTAMSHGKHAYKTVVYFIAQVQGNVHLCPDEIAAGMWIDVEQVDQKITFANMQPLLKQLHQLLKK